jgi:hypothetical protein
VRTADAGRQAGDVDECRRSLNAFAHQIDQVGSTAEIFRVLILRAADRIGRIGGALIGHFDHALRPA